MKKTRSARFSWATLGIPVVMAFQWMPRLWRRDRWVPYLAHMRSYSRCIKNHLSMAFTWPWFLCIDRRPNPTLNLWNDLDISWHIWFQMPPTVCMHWFQNCDSTLPQPASSKAKPYEVDQEARTLGGQSALAALGLTGWEWLRQYHWVMRPWSGTCKHHSWAWCMTWLYTNLY